MMGIGPPIFPRKDDLALELTPYPRILEQGSHHRRRYEFSANARPAVTTGVTTLVDRARTDSEQQDRPLRRRSSMRGVGIGAQDIGFVERDAFYKTNPIPRNVRALKALRANCTFARGPRFQHATAKGTDLEKRTQFLATPCDATRCGEFSKPDDDAVLAALDG